MIKIKSPAMSQAGNRCGGKNETGKNPGSFTKREKQVGNSRFLSFFLRERARATFVSRELFYGGAPEVTSESAKTIETAVGVISILGNICGICNDSGDTRGIYNDRGILVTLRLTVTPVSI